MKSVLMLAAALLAFAHAAAAQPAEAGAGCTRPPPPPAVDGATASLEQIQAGKQAAGAFIAASDTYQACVLDGLAAQKAAAKAAKRKLDPAAAQAADAAVKANQDDKVAVGAAFNASLKAYKAAHPAS